MRSLSLRFLSSRVPWFLAPVVLACAACTDNVGCVFVDGCTGNPPLAPNPAILPVDGEWIADAAPKVESVFPSGTQSTGITPIVLVFSESMQESSLLRAIEVLPVLGGGQLGPPVQGIIPAVVSEGRVLVLFPPTASTSDLDPGGYVVILSEDALVIDITGQELDVDPGTQLGSFSVAATPPAVPQLVMTFPANGADNQSETTQLVAVFDRPLLESSVDGDSFDVRVDGADPANDPPATAIQVSVGQNTVKDLRVFVYRSVDASDQPVPLGSDAEVELRLSRAGEPISEQDGGILASATITFDTLPFKTPFPPFQQPPLEASLLSDPNDAIGLANLTNGNPEELMVEVDLAAAQPNDFIDLYLFGTQKSAEEDPPLIALQRSLRLSGTAPIGSVIFTRELIDLQFSSSPSDVRFEDGPVTFAFRTRRGSVVTPLRVLDLDSDPDTIQDPVLDTTAPLITSLIGTTGTATFRSDQRGLSLAGDADEQLRSVEVATPLGNTPALAPVVGGRADGLFLAAPVPLGLVANGGTTYSAVARDRANNPAPAVAGSYTQLGAVGPGAFTPGLAIEVEVFDSGTLAVLPGALVLVHSDEGNGIDFSFVQAGTTLANGRVTLGTQGAPSIGAILTVVLPTYDLFTLHGVPSTRLSIPLRKSGQASALASGVALSLNAEALALAGLDKRFDDSRRAVELPRGFVGQDCLPNGTGLTCAYGPEPIRAQALGARSFFAGDFSQTEAGFSPSDLLQAFVLSIPLEPADPSELQIANLEVPFLLPDAPDEEAALDVPAFGFRLPAGSGVGTPLADDPDTTGDPFVSVETLVPGLPGTIAVGQGLAFQSPLDADLWTIRGAMPGAITVGGPLGMNGVVDTDPFVRVELADEAGNAAGLRPRLSTIQAAGLSPEFLALAAPIQVFPGFMEQTGGQAVTLRLTHSIGDSRGVPGLYRVELLDADERGWTLWRFDPSGSADVEVRMVDVADAGGVGPVDGDMLSTVSAFAWSSLSATDFLWSDVEREFELFARAAPLSFVKP